MSKIFATPARIPGFYDTNAVSDASALRCDDPSLTQQNQKDEADINTIVARFNLTGELPLSARHYFPFFDCDEVLDYRMCADRLIEAEKSFMSLPASVRTTFENDAVAFADFASLPENLSKLREWGLAPPAPPEPPKLPEAPSGA